MFRNYKKIVLITIAFVLITMIGNNIYAAKSKVAIPSKVSKITSNYVNSNEVIKISTKDTKITVNFKSSFGSKGFKVWVYKTVSWKGYRGIELGEVISNNIIYNFDKTFDLSNIDIPNGKYLLCIERKVNGVYKDTSGAIDNGSVYKNAVMTISSKKAKIHKYNDVIKENSRIRKKEINHSVSLYKDNKLMDIRFVLKNPTTKKYSNMTYSKRVYIKKISNNITKGSLTKYQKAKKIYEYVSSNFYYDSTAFESSSGQYANPYDNLYNLVNKKKSANSVSGKVATTCQGYSALYLSLARAQGIPTRLVYGHRNSIPNYIWENENKISSVDHWWAESYIGGRWITIDATLGANNTWNRNTNKWSYSGLTNYVYFDPTNEQLAVSHIAHNVYENYIFKYKAAKLKVSATSKSRKKIKIKWSRPNTYDGVSYYQVYKATSKNGKYKKIVTTKKRSYVDKKVKPKKKYYYKVRPVRKSYGVNYYGVYSQIISKKAK